MRQRLCMCSCSDDRERVSAMKPLKIQALAFYLLSIHPVILSLTHCHDMGVCTVGVMRFWNISAAQFRRVASFTHPARNGLSCFSLFIIYAYTFLILIHIIYGTHKTLTTNHKVIIILIRSSATICNVIYHTILYHEQMLHYIKPSFIV